MSAFYNDEKEPRMGLITLLSAEQEAQLDLEEPYALTDQHAAALERAIRAEGYNVLVDPETGDVKLERQLTAGGNASGCGGYPVTDVTFTGLSLKTYSGGSEPS